MAGYEIGMVRNDDRKTDQVFLGKGFGFNPLHNGRLSGSDLLGYALLNKYSTVVWKVNVSWERDVVGRKTTQRWFH